MKKRMLLIGGVLFIIIAFYVSTRPRLANIPRKEENDGVCCVPMLGTTHQTKTIIIMMVFVWVSRLNFKLNKSL
ncbi:hypothetical protein IOC57_25125 [Bacillus sp. SD075]|uniref:hypothetical protein n=1 Tax=Bacillus sp. SD075 TaxID=2781732 RepID=UPI001A961269|nr:hypothetical protein [Bacillus sp. SD075]MBO1000996.1 hypothetical protein [Bacillus sp. SD075]